MPEGRAGRRHPVGRGDHAGLVDGHRRVALTEVRCEPPTRRGPVPVQHPRLGQQKRARASGRDGGATFPRRGHQASYRLGGRTRHMGDQGVGPSLGQRGHQQQVRALRRVRGESLDHMPGSGADPAAKADRGDVPGGRWFGEFLAHGVRPVDHVEQGGEPGVEHAVVRQYRHIHDGNDIGCVVSDAGRDDCGGLVLWCPDDIRCPGPAPNVHR